ncbi:MAG: hypothetical protein HY748_03375 [Elusimicrobia bacterium]|nr:hypothetical protein [Elusimicrobiota bacterium]
MTILALAALLASPAVWAGVGGSQGASDLASRTIQLQKAAENPTIADETVRGLADRLFDGVPRAKILVQAGLRGWDMEPEQQDKDKYPASIDRLMNSADKRFTYYNPSVPDPDLKDAYASAVTLHGRGNINYDRDLSDNQMGAYKYVPASAALGLVKVNEWISGIASALGDVFAFCTLIHEAGHADRHQKGELSPNAVILGEIVSFYIEYAWLSLIDPHGERLAFLYAKALDEQKRNPSALNDMALKYAGHLYEVWGTGGDFGKLDELVKKRGYKERSPSIPDEGAPVRN